LRKITRQLAWTSETGCSHWRHGAGSTTASVKPLSQALLFWFYYLKRVLFCLVLSHVRCLKSQMHHTRYFRLFWWGVGVRCQKGNFEQDISSLKITPKNTQVTKSSLPPFQNMGKGFNVIKSVFFPLQRPLSSTANCMSHQPVYFILTGV